MFQGHKNKTGLIVILALLIITTSIAMSVVLNKSHPHKSQTTNQQEARLIHLVRHDCGSCHGMTLQGGLGKALLPENLQEAGAEGLAQIILNGVSGTPMPPWRGLLSPEEALWIAKKLKRGL